MRPKNLQEELDRFIQASYGGPLTNPTQAIAIRQAFVAGAFVAKQRLLEAVEGENEAEGEKRAGNFLDEIDREMLQVVQDGFQSERATREARG